jgi:hypothetical protein
MQSCTWRIKIILYCIVVLFCGYTLQRQSVALPYFADEYDYLSRGHFLNLIFRKDFNASMWNSYDSYDHEKFPEYYYRTVLYLFHTPLPTLLPLTPLTVQWMGPRWCQKKEYSQENCMSFIDYWMWNDPYFENGFAIDRLPQEVQAKLSPINTARIGSLAATYVVLGLFFLILYHSFSYWAGIFGVLLLSFQPVFRAWFPRAMGDVFLGLFLLMVLYASIVWFDAHAKSKRKGILIVVLIGIVSGLAMSSKLVGILGNVYFYGLLFQSRIRDKRMIVGIICLTFFLTLGIFFLLNPFVWFHPIRNIIFMFQHRGNATFFYMNQYPQNSLFYWWDRFFVLLSQIPHGTMWKVIGGWRGSFIDVGLFAGGMATLVYNSFRQSERRRIISRYFLYWCVVTLTVMTGYMGLRWDRYYMPFILCIVAVQAIGGMSLIRFIREALIFPHR